MDEFIFGSPRPAFEVAEVKTVYQLMNVITCEIIDASPNLVFVHYMGRTRMSLFLGHLDLLSRLPRSTQCIDFLT